MTNPIPRNNQPELDLIRGIRKGGNLEHQALGYITNYQKFRNSLLTFLRKNSGGEQDLMPVFNEGLLALRNKIVSLAEDEVAFFALWAYLFRACQNIWYKELKRRKKSWGMFSPLIDNARRLFSSSSNNLSAADQDKLERVEELIDDLGEPTRSVLLMRDMGASYKEIVQQLDLTNENYARQVYFNGKNRLLKEIQRAFPDDF